MAGAEGSDAGALQVYGESVAGNDAHREVVRAFKRAEAHFAGGVLLVEAITSVSSHRPADVVLVHPDVGVLVVEVKGWTCGMIEYPGGGTLSVHFKEGLREQQPLEQARQAMFAVKGAIHQRLCGADKPPIYCYMAAFPNIGAEEWARAGLDRALPKGDVLFQDDITDPDALVAKVRQTVRAGLKESRRRNPMPKGAMEAALEGLGVVRRPLWQDTAAPEPSAPSPGAERPPAAVVTPVTVSPATPAPPPIPAPTATPAPPPVRAEYSAPVSRANPLLLIFLIDQSGSMNDPMPRRDGHTKSEALASVINGLLHNLVLRCSKGEEIRDYFHIGLVTYRGTRTRCGWEGTLDGDWIQRISNVGSNPLRVDYARRVVTAPSGEPVEISTPAPVWVTPYAAGKTPMVAALRQARELVAGWLRRYRDAFPPIVINVTDGVASDGDPLAEMRAIRAMRSSDGNVLMLNVQLSKSDQPPVSFPADDRLLQSEGARTLFEGASALIPSMVQAAREQGLGTVREGAKGFVCNADFDALVNAIEIGTRPARLV